MSDDLDKAKYIKSLGGVWRKTFEAVKNTGTQIEDRGIKGVFSGVADAYARAKKEDNERRLAELYSTWCIRDTWLIYSEAVPLSLGIDP